MSETETLTVLAVGAHPDDIEFGAGGVLLKEAERGAKIHLLICSRGESGSSGSGKERVRECEAAAELLGASLRFLDFGGDAKIEYTRKEALVIAGIARELRPNIVLAPTTVANQHPDHVAVGMIARDALRLARYGGIEELKGFTSHAVDSLLHYAITPEAEPRDVTALLVEIGPVFEKWVKLMECHASQMKTRNYVELQTARARMLGLQAGGAYAQALYPNDRLLIEDLASAPTGVRRF